MNTHVIIVNSKRKKKTEFIKNNDYKLTYLYNLIIKDNNMRNADVILKFAINRRLNITFIKFY